MNASANDIYKEICYMAKMYGAYEEARIRNTFYKEEADLQSLWNKYINQANKVKDLIYENIKK